MVSHRHRSDIIKGDIPDMWSITIIAVQKFLSNIYEWCCFSTSVIVICIRNYMY